MNEIATTNVGTDSDVVWLFMLGNLMRVNPLDGIGAGCGVANMVVGETSEFFGASALRF